MAILKSISENSLEKQSASRVVNLPGFLPESRTGIFFYFSGNKNPHGIFLALAGADLQVGALAAPGNEAQGRCCFFRWKSHRLLAVK